MRFIKNGGTPKRIDDFQFLNLTHKRANVRVIMFTLELTAVIILLKESLPFIYQIFTYLLTLFTPIFTFGY